MDLLEAYYCLACGNRNERGGARCLRCGASSTESDRDRLSGTAFLLNELARQPITGVLEDEPRARLASHYRARLDVAVERVFPASRPAPQPRRAAPPAPPPKPSEPRDWSWVVEQQANLFLFAGAFLTVVAALIYVGYSGQAVDGALKMTLLVAYTAAFIAAGILCRRVPRVEIAGRVFLAIGAVLVPLNFVAARGIFADEDLSAQSLWLSGSLVSAAFYTALALSGLGRGYAFAAGAALSSALGAALAVAGIAPEWAPLWFVALALVMSLASVRGPEAVRARVGAVWAAQADAITALALIASALVALVASADSSDADISTRWFLPLTFAGVFAQGVALTLLGRRTAATAALAGLGGAILAVVYATGAPAEDYAVAFAAVALVLGAAGVWVDRGAASRLPAGAPETLRIAALGSTLAAGLIVAGALESASGDDATYDIANRWFVLATALVVLAYYLTAAFVRRETAGVFGACVACAAASASVVYALDVSAEYYAFALIAPALALIAAVRFAQHPLLERLPAAWRDDVLVCARASAAAGAAVALTAAVVSLDATSGFAPDTRIWLTIALAAAAAYCALDAARRKSPWSSAALAASLAGIGVSVPYAFDAGAGWYGVAFVASGIALSLARRALPGPAWLDGDAADAVSAVAVTAGWLAFEGDYAARPRLGAAAHLGAAAWYAAAALVSRSRLSLGELLNSPDFRQVRLSTGWVYAAGLTATIGYVQTLAAVGSSEDASAGTLALPLLLASAASVAAGVALRARRPDLRAHVYAVALGIALAAFATADNPRDIAVVLTAATALSVAVSLIERAGYAAAPAVVFWLGAVAAWRDVLGLDEQWLPVAYSVSASALFGLSLAPRVRSAARPLRYVAIVYATVAPAVGFAMLSYLTGEGRIDRARFYTSGLWETSTVAVAVLGLLVAATARIDARRWAFVPASALITLALLLQIGRFDPGNPQAYTAVIGAYLLLLGLVGLTRERWVPEAIETAPFIEAAGALIIMLPSFFESLDGAWRYEGILLLEAAAFLAGGVAMRRRGPLAAALFALLLVAGRALFDAVNVIPNWVAVMAAGAALLAVGMAILAGRERWGRWQEALVRWWRLSEARVDRI